MTDDERLKRLVDKNLDLMDAAAALGHRVKELTEALEVDKVEAQIDATSQHSVLDQEGGLVRGLREQIKRDQVAMLGLREQNHRLGKELGKKIADYQALVTENADLKLTLKGVSGATAGTVEGEIARLGATVGTLRESLAKANAREVARGPQA